jgi:hypothetical protein
MVRELLDCGAAAPLWIYGLWLAVGYLRFYARGDPGLD